MRHQSGFIAFTRARDTREPPYFCPAFSLDNPGNLLSVDLRRSTFLVSLAGASILGKNRLAPRSLPPPFAVLRDSPKLAPLRQGELRCASFGTRLKSPRRSVPVPLRWRRFSRSARFSSTQSDCLRFAPYFQHQQHLGPLALRVFGTQEIRQKGQPGG